MRNVLCPNTTPNPQSASMRSASPLNFASSSPNTALMTRRFLHNFSKMNMRTVNHNEPLESRTNIPAGLMLKYDPYNSFAAAPGGPARQAWNQMSDWTERPLPGPSRPNGRTTDGTGRRKRARRADCKTRQQTMKHKTHSLTRVGHGNIYLLTSALK